MQSVFGYISVLPGAFSAYRYKALQNGPDGRGPLASYFRGETLHGGGADGAGLFGTCYVASIEHADLISCLAERNMYLAEDRILCFEIVTKKNEAWTLRYVKSAKAATDVPTTVRILHRVTSRMVFMDLPNIGSGVHLSASSLVERFSLRFDPCHHLLLPHLDVRPEPS